jgi:extracellular elastinolytic metalloproteinase
MRTYFLTTLAAAGLAAAAASHGHQGGARKSLGFGAIHPNAGLRASCHTDSFAPSALADDPLEVAREHVRRIARDYPEKNFVVREDSYTDKATGVTHVYVRQLVDGFEVVDGDMNINVKDGQVLSWGDSVCFHLRFLFSVM